MARKQSEKVPTKHKKNRSIPEMPESPEYPFLHTEIDPSGQGRIYSTELGNQWEIAFHPSGTFKITYPDGSSLDSSPGESKIETISQTVTVKHNQDVNVGGKSKVHIEGGSWMEVMGNMDVTVGKGAHVNVLGDAAIAVNGNVHLAGKKNVNLDAAGDFNVRAKGALNLGSDGGVNIQSTKITMQEAGDGSPGYNWKRA